MNGAINWLHFTDLHFGQPNEWLWPRMRRQLFDDLSKLVDEVGPWDVVFFTGDFVQRGSNDEFLGVSEELLRLWEHMKSLGSTPILLAVPGNHDLLRPEPTDPIARISLRWHEPSEENVRSLFWFDDNCSYRQHVSQAFQNYTNWINELQIPQPELVRGILPGDFSARIQISGVQLGVIGLNTSFLQLLQDNYEGKLDVHTKQIQAVCNEDADKWCHEVDIAILMTHQPQNWLHPLAKAQFTEILSQNRIFTHFCGHMHDPRIYDVSEAGTSVQRIRQGLSLFGLEKYGISRLERIFGYTLGRWVIDQDEGTEYLWPRRAQKLYTGLLNLGPDTSNVLDTRNRIVKSFDIFDRNKHVKTDVVESLNVTPDAIHSNKEKQEVCFSDKNQIISIEKNIDYASAKIQLKGVPRLRLKAEEQNRAIRKEEQARFEAILHKKRVAWLVADWGSGKDGFLACALDRVVGKGGMEDVFRLQCGDVDSYDGILAATETQFGFSFQEFCAVNAALSTPVLIFDDLPQSFVAGGEIDDFQRLLKSTLDFCPPILIVIISRQAPQGVDIHEIVTLRPLEAPEVRSYILHHPLGQPSLDDADILERIHTWSGGLPMHIDRLLEALQISSLHEILNESSESHIISLSEAEPVPKSLKQAVNFLVGSSDPYSRRSLKLLKVLTMLSEGETIESIKRFYPSEPFGPKNAVELHRLSLIEALPLSQTSADISLHSGQSPMLTAGIPKILRVPRQVRDYVRSLMTEEEQKDIIHASTELLFGRKWREGKIRLRSELQDSFGLKPMGPGNEHIVTRHLLAEALKKNDGRVIKRAARLAHGYCYQLLSADRFHDAVTACREIVHLLMGTDYIKEFVNVAIIYGKTLRMTGSLSESIELFQIILERGMPFLSNDEQSSIYLNIAMAHESKLNKAEALASARKVIELSPHESRFANQAEAIIAGLSLSGEERRKRLIHLEQIARAKKQNIVANNITLSLAKSNKCHDEALEQYERVIISANDDYNRVRAIIGKAQLLNALNRSSELSDKDRRLLSSAYSYTYAQRIGELLDKCHSVIWSMFTRENRWGQLLRLFRFSSFVWRLKGTEEKELKYLKKLEMIDFDKIQQSEKQELHNEITYLDCRRNDYPLCIGTID